MFWLLVAAIWAIKVGFHKTHAASTMLAQGKLLHKKSVRIVVVIMYAAWSTKVVF